MQLDNMSSRMPSILWGMNTTFWVAGGILIIVSILLLGSKWKQKLKGPPPRTSLKGWNSSKLMRNYDWSLSQNMDRYIRRWRNIKIHLYEIHPRSPCPFPFWSFHILNNHDQHHLPLWSPHSTLKNHLQLLPVLWNALRIQPLQILPPNLSILPIFHHSLSCCLQCFKFLLLIIVMVNHDTTDIIRSQSMLQEAVLMTQMEVPNHLLSHCGSQINDKPDGHHMSKRGTHYG